MTNRLLAWALFLACIWGVYTWARSFKNPFSQVPTVTSVMPAMTHCKEDCTP